MSGLAGLFYGRTSTPSAAKGTLPPAGEFAFYIDSADNHWKFIDSAATVVDITDLGASTFPDVTIADATPQLTFKDTDCTDSDDNATIIATATATGSGAEDIDVAFQAQANGTAVDYLAYTASNDAVVHGNNSSSLVGFYGEAGVNKGTAMTGIASALTHTAPGTPDAAIQDLVSTAASFGFVTKDEGNTVLRNIVNMASRINEIESRLQDINLIN